MTKPLGKAMNQWKMLVEEFGPDRVAKALEYEPNEIVSRAKRNADVTLDESLALKRLFHELVANQATRSKAAQEARQRADEDARLQKAYFEDVARQRDGVVRAYQLLVHRVCWALERALGFRFSLGFEVSQLGRVHLSGKVSSGPGKALSYPREVDDRFHVMEDGIGLCLVRVVLEKLFADLETDITSVRYLGDEIGPLLESLEHETMLTESWCAYCEERGIQKPERSATKTTWEGTAKIGDWRWDVWSATTRGQERLMVLKRDKRDQPQILPLFPHAFSGLRPKKGFPELTEAELKARLW